MPTRVLSVASLAFLAATTAANAQEPFANFEGTYIGRDTTTVFADPESKQVVDFDIVIDISQFGETVSFFYERNFEENLASILEGEAVVSGNSFFGDDVLSRTRPGAPPSAAFDTIEATLTEGPNGAILTGSMMNAFRRVDFVATCESGGACATAIEGGGEVQAFVFFRGLGGPFGDATNWEPQRVPSNDDTAVFDRELTSSVTIGTATTRRLQFESGTATFNGDTLDLTESSETTGLRSLEVGIATTGSAFLFIHLSELNTIHTAIGRDPNANGALGVGSSALWNNQGRLSIGLGGGALLDIAGGATVLSGESRIGDEAGSVGAVDVFTAIMPKTQIKEGAQFLSNWDTGNLAVGFQGMGTLDITDASVTSDTVDIGSQAGSSGAVNVTGSNGLGEWEILGSLNVGNDGPGSLTIREQSTITVGEDFNIGRGSGGGSTVIELSTLATVGLSVAIQGDGSFTARDSVVTTSFLSIARLAIDPDEVVAGEVILDNTDMTVTGSIEIGSNVDDPDDPQGTPIVAGEGRLRLTNDARIFVDDDVNVEFGGEIRGNGTLIVGGAIIDDSGAIAPGIQVLKDDPEKQNEDGSRTLEFDANYTKTGGSINVTIDGTANGQFDQLIITGDATLTDTTLDVTFNENFTPTTGEEFPIIMVQGAFTTQNLTTQIQGADPTFEFALTEINGMLTIMTTTGAEPSNEGSTEGQGDGNGDNGGGCAASTLPTTNSPIAPDYILLLLAALATTQLRRKTAAAHHPSKN